MKTIAKLFLFIILLALPFGGRWLYYDRGNYQAPEIATVEASRIKLPELEYKNFEETPKLGNGRVVLDLTHQNNLAIDDLTPLRNKLSERGVTVESFTGYEDELGSSLRGATALVVLAPTFPFSDLERQVIQDFVKDGGRLLMAADPTRSIVYMDEYGYVDIFSLLYPISAVPAINSLANDYGISFYEDYLYTLSGYEGNYRNVRYDFQDGSVVLFAAHSISSDGKALLTGGQDVLSNLRTGQIRLTPAVFAPEGQVLALGDINVLISPYYKMVDNDRFLSYLADWLAVDSRSRDLHDFPYLFDGPVDMVQTINDILPSGAIEQITTLQGLFSQVDITATLNITLTPGHDTLVLSTFEHLQAVEQIMQSAGVTVTLLPKESNGSTGDDAQSEPSSTVEDVEATPLRDTITIADLGTFTLRGLSLFIVDKSQGGTVLVVLAEDVTALDDASSRLISSDFSNCLTHENITLCPGQNTESWTELTGGETIPEGNGSGEAMPLEPTPEPTNDSGLQQILIVSIDDGEGGTSTGADEFASALFGTYDITIWSTQEAGYPTGSDLSGYDAYILAFGDYPFPEDDFERSLLISEMTGPVLLVGSQPLPPYLLTTSPAQIVDLEVADDTHPLAFGYINGDIIDLLPAENDTPSLVLNAEEITTSGESAIVYVRGSNSAEMGSPAVVASENDTGQRVVIAIFPFQRLPLDTQFFFAVNVSSWLLGEY